MGGLEQDRAEYEARIARESQKVVNNDLIVIKNEDGTTNMVLMVGHKTKSVDGNDATCDVMCSIVNHVIYSDEWTEEIIIEELKDWGFVAKVIKVDSVQIFKLK